MSEYSNPKSWDAVFLGKCLILLVLLSWLALGTSHSLAQGIDDTPGDLSSVARVELSDLQYGERVLKSPYSTVDYTLRVPEGWHLQEGSFFELDVSYTYNPADALEEPVWPFSFGNIIVTLDGEVQQIFSIDESTQVHARLRVDLPPSVFNATGSRSHNIKVTLDASYICGIPHNAYLTIHPTSFFSLPYEQRPIEVDLARYPRPFYQNALEPDRVQFVLPNNPSAAELTVAGAVSSKLGAMTYGMMISGTLDSDLLDQMDEQGEEFPYEHLIVVGTPERNEVIGALNRLDALPVALEERQLHLASRGPVSVMPGAQLTYTLRVTNTTDVNVSSLSMVSAILTPTEFVSCSPACSELSMGELRWDLPPLSPGAVVSRTLVLRAREMLTPAMMENTVTLLDATDNPVNVSTLTTTLRASAHPDVGVNIMKTARSSSGGYFFVQDERGAPESDGVIQMLVSPWASSKAILVLTGLSEEAVDLASQAMSSENRFPGLAGSSVLVRGPAPGLERPQTALDTEMTFADLGYEGRMLEGFNDGVSYYFDIPVGWHLTEETSLNLSFRYSQNLDYDRSSLNVSLNYEPIATVALSDQMALDDALEVDLPLSLVRYGEDNVISVQAELFPLDECAYSNVWLRVNNTSALHLAHTERDEQVLNLDFFPHPFDLQSDLTDVLFALPEKPQIEEWTSVLRLAAAMGGASGGLDFAPATTLGMPKSEAALSAHHIIAVGRPTRNVALQEVNDQLPQPFLPHSDVIDQKLNWVTLRFPSDVSLGYVQLIASPWNEARALLAVTGTTDEGVQQAADVLVDQPWYLNGNLALIKDGTVNTIDTREFGGDYVQTSEPVSTDVVTATATVSPTDPTATPSATISPDATDLALALSSEEETVNRPGWLIPLVIAAGLALLIVLGVAWWQYRSRNANL